MAPKFTFNERLLQLNDSDRDIWTSIDRPIRPLIWELNRVGLSTKWCCCGFNYRDEEEPKTHAKNPFVVLKPIVGPKGPTRSKGIAAFFALAKVSTMCGWMLRPYHQNGEWHMMFKRPEESFYQESEDGLDGVHNYESSLIAIQSLVKHVRLWPASDEKFVIFDGNTGYNEITNGEWQVDPKKEVTFDATINPYDESA